MTTEFKPGDRVRIRDSAPVRLAAQSDRMGIVLACIVLAWHDHGMADVWVHSQCCDFDLDFTELQLVSRPVYPKPGEVIVALSPDDLRSLSRLASVSPGCGHDDDPAKCCRLHRVLARAREASQ
jgi:hypothetical protein